MAKDILGQDLEPGDPIIFSTHIGRSASWLHLGVIREIRPTCVLVTTYKGFKRTIKVAGIMKLTAAGSEKAAEMALRYKEASL